jgi:hypothetical protein
MHTRSLSSLVFVSSIVSLACSARGGTSLPPPVEMDVPMMMGDDTPATGDTLVPADRVTPLEDRVTPPEDRVAPPEDRMTPPEDLPVVPRCGDGACQAAAGETCSTCMVDCGACAPRCGDGTCNGSETCSTCMGDCGPCMMMGNNYARGTTTASIVEACTLPGVTRLLASADDVDATVPAPFTLYFFGLPVPMGTTLHVSSNGYISLTPPPSSLVETSGGTIPSSMAPNGLVAAYWTDLITGPDGVCVATVGSAPSRRFVVQWKNAGFYPIPVPPAPIPPTGRASFELIYNETDRSIDFLYETIMGEPAMASTRAAVGIENVAGTGGFAICAGGRRAVVADPIPPECTAVTSGTRLRLVTAP